jgi:hypothetical protein
MNSEDQHHLLDIFKKKLCLLKHKQKMQVHPLHKRQKQNQLQLQVLNDLTEILRND